MSEIVEHEGTPAPVEEPAAPVAEVETPADPDEQLATEIQGAKMVPLDALKAARAEAKSYKEKAAKVDEVSAWYEKNRPYVEVLAQNPNLIQRAMQPPPPPAQPTAQQDPELVELARSLDYYKADGTPDLERAAKHQQIIERQATKIAQRMVAPVAHQSATQQSAANWQLFATQKLPNGQPIDPRILGKYWQALPPEHTSDRRVAAVAFNLAAMEQMQNSPLPPQPAAPNGPPVHTESVGRAPVQRVQMNDTERQIANARGMNEKTYADLTKGFQPGRPTPLED